MHTASRSPRGRRRYSRHTDNRNSNSNENPNRGQNRNRNGNRGRNGDPNQTRPARTEPSRHHEPSDRRTIGETPRPIQSFEASFPADGSNAFGLLLPAIQAALNESGYHTPTPVQAQCIKPLLEGRDLLGSAQTGTGKTAAFTLPLLQYLTNHPGRTQPRKPRVLILAPTRELAAQIGDSVKTYGKHLQVKHAVVFGGVGQFPQEKAMNRGVDVLVATPGRLLDLMGQGIVKLDAVEAFVLDEADRMLDMGFIHDVRKVIADLPAKRHSLFFSATLAREVVSLAQTLLTNPVHVTIQPEQPTVDRIDQCVMFVDRHQKDGLLIDKLSQPGMDKVIVFVQRKRIANQVTAKLDAAGIPADVIHGNKSQNARTAALEGLRRGKIRALVATDIAARGIDIDGITHVINYELPMEPESYVHRIGRTARAGMRGDAVSFCMASERAQLRAIEKLIRKSIPVDRDHAVHSEAAEFASGAEARPVPRGGRGGGGQRQNGRSRRGASPRDYAVDAAGGGSRRFQQTNHRARRGR